MEARSRGSERKPATVTYKVVNAWHCTADLASNLPQFRRDSLPINLLYRNVSYEERNNEANTPCTHQSYLEDAIVVQCHLKTELLRLSQQTVNFP